MEYADIKKAQERRKRIKNQMLEYENSQQIGRALRNKGFKSAYPRAQHILNKTAIQKLNRERITKSITQPKSNFIAVTTRESRKPYRVNEYNEMTQKPREWHRLNRMDAWRYNSIMGKLLK